jgi:Coenzyme PQQ synthesis protein D (PqqD)
MLSTDSISLNSTIVQSPGNIVSDMDGEKVMLSVKNGKYYNLGEIGGAIWEQLEKPILITDLVAALMSEYDVNQTDCEEQVLSFLNLLARENLILSSNDASS